MIRITTIAAALAIALPLLAPAPASANIVRNACQSAERAGSRVLCSCIQRAADATLSWREQRQAARIFRDPHRAQVLRMSKNTRDEQFWDNYKRFASVAERSCG